MSNEEFIFDDDNTENEDDLGIQRVDDYSKAVLWGTDWTTETIINQLNKNNIEMNPDFQRRDAWDDEKKSKFIESLILGLPVPPIILAESLDKKNSYIVIDGKQRLLSIMQFHAEKNNEKYRSLDLKGLEILESINGRNYNDLEEIQNGIDFINQFDNQSIRTVVIRNWNDEKFLYTVFLRLNTGSLKLSPQELRQALHPGDFLTFANKYALESEGLKNILKLKKPDPRMRDVELLLRYYAFKNFENDYKGSLKDFLDETCNLINLDWNDNSEKYKKQAEELEKAIVFVQSVFEQRKAFSKFLEGKYTNIFNRTIFDIMVITFSEENNREKYENDKNAIKKSYEKLMTEDKKFLYSVSGSTKDLDKTVYRFKEWRKALKLNV